MLQKGNWADTHSKVTSKERRRAGAWTTKTYHTIISEDHTVTGSQCEGKERNDEGEQKVKPILPKEEGNLNSHPTDGKATKSLQTISTEGSNMLLLGRQEERNQGFVYFI